MQTEATPALYAKLALLVRAIPRGMVTSYGDLAEMLRCDPRLVGYGLSEMGSTLPWQRVVNREGAISTRGSAQRALLEAEGVAFDPLGRVLMARHRWRGPSTEFAAEHGLRPLPPRLDAEQLDLFS